MQCTVSITVIQLRRFLVKYGIRVSQVKSSNCFRLWVAVPCRHSGSMRSQDVCVYSNNIDNGVGLQKQEGSE